jgi:hypothetical protein
VTDRGSAALRRLRSQASRPRRAVTSSRVVVAMRRAARTSEPRSSAPARSPISEARRSRSRSRPRASRRSNAQTPGKRCASSGHGSGRGGNHRSAADAKGTARSDSRSHRTILSRCHRRRPVRIPSRRQTSLMLTSETPRSGCSRTTFSPMWWSCPSPRSGAAPKLNEGEASLKRGFSRQAALCCPAPGPNATPGRRRLLGRYHRPDVGSAASKPAKCTLFGPGLPGFFRPRATLG